MASYDQGKDYVVNWIKENFDRYITILDVGACDGKWRQLLNDFPNMDAVEIFEPNYRNIKCLYANAFNCDISKHRYRHYDLIIFGDVIEHMTVKAAQKVLRYAKKHCACMIVAVPYLYEQGEINGNPWERHVQDDLTEELFNERYPGFTSLYKVDDKYEYFYMKGLSDGSQL